MTGKRFSDIIIMPERKAAISISQLRPINPLAACSLVRANQKRVDGSYGINVQKRLGLDLEVADDFGHWLAGFTDGEGCFAASMRQLKGGWHSAQIRFIIGLRKDDIAILEKILNTLGVGTISIQRRRSSNRAPLAQFVVRRIGNLYHVIIPLFEKYPLRAKKARDFEIWKKIVETQYHEGGHRGLQPGKGTRALPESYWDRLGSLIHELQEGRKYQDDNT